MFSELFLGDWFSIEGIVDVIVVVVVVSVVVILVVVIFGMFVCVVVAVVVVDDIVDVVLKTNFAGLGAGVWESEKTSPSEFMFFKLSDILVTLVSIICILLTTEAILNPYYKHLNQGFILTYGLRTHLSKTGAILNPYFQHFNQVKNKSHYNH